MNGRLAQKADPPHPPANQIFQMHHRQQVCIHASGTWYSATCSKRGHVRAYQGFPRMEGELSSTGDGNRWSAVHGTFVYCGIRRPGPKNERGRSSGLGVWDVYKGHGVSRLLRRVIRTVLLLPRSFSVSWARPTETNTFPTLVRTFLTYPNLHHEVLHLRRYGTRLPRSSCPHAARGSRDRN